MHDADERQIRELADRLTIAEASGDAATILASFTQDAVIMPPFADVLEGAAAREAFVQTVLGANALELENRTLTYEALELRVLGDWAFERGTYLHSFVPRDPAEEPEERGKYVRIYERGTDGPWRVARVIWNHSPGPERGNRAAGDEPAAPGETVAGVRPAAEP